MAKRLKLRKVTLRDVNPDALKHVAGGCVDSVVTCNCSWTCPTDAWSQCGSCRFSDCVTDCNTCMSYCQQCPC
jgi:hypothetical protein